MLQRLKVRARALKAELHALYLAAIDPRTPWYAKGLVLLIVAYAVSPIDLIPDFVPVLGYLDDAIILPAGIALALRLIPPNVLAEARLRASEPGAEGRLRWYGAALILVVWILAMLLAAALVLRILRDR